MVKHIFKKKKISENKRILKRKTWKNGKKHGGRWKENNCKTKKIVK